MEQVLTREKKVPAGYEDIVLYDDDGNRVTNLETLQSIREGQAIIAEWEARMERYEREGVFDGWEEDEYIDESKKVVGK